MKFCSNCILPNTRPQVALEDNGLCNACLGALEKNQAIDWKAREEELAQIFDEARGKNKSSYDCLVPVSGGKDSTWQVHTLINKYKLEPLALTWKPTQRTEIGKRNLENLINLGVDHIDFTVNPKIEKNFMLKSFVKNGSPSLCEHMVMYAISVRTAINWKIPSVIWGENPGLEYGGSQGDRNNQYMNTDWIQKYGVSNGTTVKDWIDDELTEQDMLPYTFPSDEEVEQAKIRPIFLGWYLKWDPLEVANFSRNVGFEWANKPQLGYYRYADLDAPFVVIHHFLKWHKFGFTRTWDNLSIEIRNNRMTRNEALQYIKDNPEPVPYKQIYQLCQYIGISEMKFWEIVEKHRNLDIWKKDIDGKWYLPHMIKELGFMPDNYPIT